MALKTSTRLLTKTVLAGGALYAYSEAGLWRGAEETIENYDKIKKLGESYIESLPVVPQVAKDIQAYASTKTAPVTQSMSEFRRKWLSYDLSWIGNEDGIIKPTWNKGVSFIIDFLAHSPETIKEGVVTGYNKANDYLTSDPQMTTTKKIVNE